MIKIYFICAIVFMVVGAYFMGAHIGRTECGADLANAQITDFLDITKTKRVIDDKTVRTNVRDIRRILHTKYTIAE